jgi:hypothetical protein
VILTIGTATMQTNKCDDARYGTANHTQATYASAKSGSYAQGCVTVHAIHIGKGCYNALTTAEALCEKVYGEAYTLFHFR